MIPTILTTLAVGTQVLSQAGQALIATILLASTWVPGSQILTGHTFIVPDANTTTAPGEYLNDETIAIRTYPVGPGTEHCTGNTGALLCEISIKLTGSGGHSNHNAGSWVCTTYSCAVLSSDVFVEANPAAQSLWAGWTNTPGTSSGAQLINLKTTASGGMIVGSGSYTRQAGVMPDNGLVIPPGATVKAIWRTGLTGTRSEDYSAVKALWVTRYYKFYTP